MSAGPRTPLRIGILGAARIAPAAIVAPSRVTGHRLVAIAARDAARAEAFAAQHGVERVAADYASLIADDEIDVVYNALPNSAHAPLNILALRAGKHVLSEKPSAANADEAREVAVVVNAGTNVFMEGFHYLHHPALTRALDVAASGEIGDVTHVESALVIPPPGPGDLRWDFSLAGGSLMDLGCYALHVQHLLARRIAGEGPRVVAAEATAREDGVDADRIDAAMTVTLALPGGATGTARSSFMARTASAPLVIRGTRGEVRMEDFVKASNDDRVTVVTPEGERTEHHGTLSTFTHQLMAFADAVRLGTPPPVDALDAVHIAELIDAAYTAAGLPVRPRAA